MTILSFYTADIFTDRRFGGNPLAVVLGGEALDDATMQSLASEFNLSETTFVLPPADPARTARVRIFNRTAEMDFAGHPMVGTAFVLAGLNPKLNDATFEIPAGIVRITIERGPDAVPVGAAIEAPRPLQIGENIGAEMVSRALRLSAEDVVMTHHAPVLASNGIPFAVCELAPGALARCSPDLDGFRQALDSHPGDSGRFSLLVYERDQERIRARMFAPLAGTWEDPATGSACSSLACLLLSLAPDRATLDVRITQGVEMGRPSELEVHARRTSDGIVATLRGRCISVMRGVIAL